MYLGIPKLCFIPINTYVYKPVGRLIKVYNELKLKIIKLQPDIL